MTGPFPSAFLPGIIVTPCWRMHPLPTDSPGLATLIVNLFREVCGLGESSELTFEFEEFFDAPKDRAKTIVC
jgi:hypothetical protein